MPKQSKCERADETTALPQTDKDIAHEVLVLWVEDEDNESNPLWEMPQYAWDLIELGVKAGRAAATKDAVVVAFGDARETVRRRALLCLVPSSHANQRAHNEAVNEMAQALIADLTLAAEIGEELT